MLQNNKSSGVLFDYTRLKWSTIDGQPLLEKFPKFATEPIPESFLKDLQDTGVVVFDGINTGYMIIFSICAVCYLTGWLVMKSLVPKYSPITDL